MTIFHKLVWSCGVFMKWLQHTLVKIPQWSCKITPFLPRQKQLCSQWPVSVHVSLIDNELLLTPPLSAVFFCSIKWCFTIKTKLIQCSSWALMSGKMRLYPLLHHYKTLGLGSCSNTERKWREYTKYMSRLSSGIQPTIRSTAIWKRQTARF